MAESSREWASYKETVLAKIGDFSAIYGDLERQKPSGNGWRLACCPFHEDRNPSFGFNTKTGQWVCHSGCGKGSVFDYLMLTSGRGFKETLLELGDRFDVPRPNGSKPNQVVYNYRDKNGELIFQVVKGPNKTFRQRRPDGKGDWVWNLRGVKRVLYRLPDLISRPGETVFVVEGERDTDRLQREGLLATTNPGGAGKWSNKYNNYLKCRDTVILPDNDNPGGKHAQEVATALYGVARSIKIVALPDLPEKGDVSDWLSSGHPIEELVSIVDKTEEWRPSQKLQVRPEILINQRQLRDVVEDTREAILTTNQPPKLFLSSDCPSRLVVNNNTLRIQFMNEDQVYGHLIRVADWYRIQGEKTIDAKPPREIAKDFLANPYQDLPKLESVITTPIFNSRGQLISEPGYHPKDRIWYQPLVEFMLDDLPVEPTDEQVSRAKDFLNELLVDFPFSAVSDRAHALGALILPFVRQMIPGCTPIHLIEATTPGSGKNLLADVISIIAVGRTCIPTTITRNEDETRKKITAILTQGNQIVLIDNLEGGLESSQIAAALTAETWTDRLLGKSQMVELTNRAIWIVTANNPQLSLEIARRSVRIRLAPGEERPWERTSFTNDPLRDWVHENRSQLVWSIINIIQSWIAAGCPVGVRTLGSFERWADVIGGILQHVGIEGFLANTQEFYQVADYEGQQWNALIHVWQKQFDIKPTAVKDLLSMAESRDLIGFAVVGDSEQARKVRLAKKLTSLRGRRFGDWRIEITYDKRTKASLYCLIPVESELFQCAENENDSARGEKLRSVAEYPNGHSAVYSAPKQ